MSADEKQEGVRTAAWSVIALVLLLLAMLVGYFVPRVVSIEVLDTGSNYPFFIFVVIMLSAWAFIVGCTAYLCNQKTKNLALVSGVMGMCHLIYFVYFGL